MYIQKWGNKYGAKRTEYAGLRYDSKFEASYAMGLDAAIQSGEIKSYERQVTLDLKVNGLHITNYRIDFIIHHNDGSREYAEVKGMETYEWRIKWRLLEALFDTEFRQHPEDSMTVVKQRNWGPPRARKLSPIKT